MAFNQQIHIEQDIEERLDMHWDFQPSRPVRNQNYFVASIVAPEGTNQKTESIGIKVFGCFNTIDEANKYSQQLQKECNFFDYYVAEVGAWLKLPPQVEKLDDVHYQEGELEKLKGSILEMRQSRAKILEQRVIEAKKQAAAEAAARLEEEEAAAADSSSGVEEVKGGEDDDAMDVPASEDMV